MNTEKKPRATSIRPFVMGLVLGVLGGMLGMAWYQSSREECPPPQAQAAGAGECPPTDPTPTAEAYPTRDAEDFNFYGVLEKVPVTPARPDLERPPAPPTVTPAQPTVAQGRPFYLQVASFKAAAEADALKAKIALAGGMAEVVAMEIPEKGTYFRVRLGPYATQEALGRARQQLQQAGIDLQQAIVVR
jgi:cell division protein FtsN